MNTFLFKCSILIQLQRKVQWDFENDAPRYRLSSSRYGENKIARVVYEKPTSSWKQTGKNNKQKIIKATYNVDLSS